MVNTEDLRKQILLGDLNDEEIEKLGRRMIVESYPRGSHIFREGDRIKGICLVNKGKVEISKTTPDGWKQTLTILTSGHFFGELSVIENIEKHGANATAMEDTEVYLLKKEDFRELEETEQAMMYKIMKTIARIGSRNVHAMNEKLVKLLISY
jgi:CRP-like cAMP-binding protein